MLLWCTPVSYMMLNTLTGLEYPDSLTAAWTDLKILMTSAYTIIPRR